MTWGIIHYRIRRMVEYPFTVNQWVFSPDAEPPAWATYTPRVMASRVHLLHNLLDMLPRP